VHTALYMVSVATGVHSAHCPVYGVSIYGGTERTLPCIWYQELRGYRAHTAVYMVSVATGVHSAHSPVFGVNSYGGT